MKKKYVVEFGLRGGHHTDCLVLTTEKQARVFAANLVMIFAGRTWKGAHQTDWHMTTGVYRKSWQGEAHFVAVTVLDGVMRGPASSKLWKKDDIQQGFKEESYDQITH